MSDFDNQALDWNSQITQDDQQFELLQDGEYDFVVESMERGRFAGSEKMSACPQAKLTLRVVNPETGNDVRILETLNLHKKMEWRLSQFFVCIGQKKKGEPLAPNWNTVPGSTGKARVVVNEYTKDGQTRKNNKVDTFLPKEQKAWTPGNF